MYIRTIVHRDMLLSSASEPPTALLAYAKAASIIMHAFRCTRVYCNNIFLQTSLFLVFNAAQLTDGISEVC